MLELFLLPGSLVFSDIIGLNDVTQVSWKFPAGTSESCPLCVPEVQLGIIQRETQQHGFFPHTTANNSIVSISACLSFTNSYLKRHLIALPPGENQKLSSSEEGRVFSGDDWPAVRSSLSRLLYLHRSSHEHLLLSSAGAGTAPVAY